MKKKIYELCAAAMLAALICVGTLVIQIPLPFGYLNFGDCFVLVAAWVLSPAYGFAAAGLGSALADLLSGYAVYAPASFLIKGIAAITAAFIAGKLRSKKLAGKAIGGICGEALMVGGYYVYEAAVLGYGIAGAAASVFGNALQGAVGAIAGTGFMLVIGKTGIIKKLSYRNN